MSNTTEILNAQITDIFLGYEDHDILTFALTLDIEGGLGYVFGGYPLDEYDSRTKKRCCRGYSMELITEIIKVVGVRRWEDLKYKYIKVILNKDRNKITTIGNIMNNEWFDIDEFYNRY